ncbi:hypothetical protein P154DRAFT_49837 [Amniculicola lignicola CBS 123094]|uniref:RRM domain-containing protein n=1 Tax=Amniculicola lignicola CBS 123094 TaxID=1392246 RepID=A0A6A5VWA4_9PLEO|nr:hypothetical protein P154DRAFT_49837 [Amniculicola lignicola CBS 123094]
MSSISEKCRSCISTLKAINSASNARQDLAVDSDQVNEELDRFSLWIGNIGALHRPNSSLSLETRLLNADDVLLHITELLDDLQEVTNELLDIVSGNREGRVASADFDESEDDSEAEDEIEEDLNEEKELLEEIGGCISRLFRISSLIRQAAPTDLFDKALSRNRYQFNDQFDVAHVGEMYPKLSSQDLIWLRKRLGRAITQRRHYLSYIQDHRDRLEGLLTIKEDEELPAPKAPPTISMKLDFTKAPLDTASRPSTFFTKATSLAPGRITPQMLAAEDDSDPDNDTRSYTTISRTIDGDPDSVVTARIPKLRDLQTNHRKEVECPFCFRMKKFKNERAWKRHVFSDIRAYICTFPECGAPYFGDINEWFKHEMQNHRVEYVCRLCKGKTYFLRERYMNHMRREHTDITQSGGEEAVLDMGRRPLNQIPAQDCPCCTEYLDRVKDRAAAQGLSPQITGNIVTVVPSDFKRHLASHLEQLALFAIPIGSATGDDVDSNVAVEEDKETLSNHTALTFDSTRPSTPANDTVKPGDADDAEQGLEIQATSNSTDSEKPPMSKAGAERINENTDTTSDQETRPFRDFDAILSFYEYLKQRQYSDLRDLSNDSGVGFTFNISPTDPTKVFGRVYSTTTTADASTALGNALAEFKKLEQNFVKEDEDNLHSELADAPETPIILDRSFYQYLHEEGDDKRLKAFQRSSRVIITLSPKENHSEVLGTVKSHDLSKLCENIPILKRRAHGNEEIFKHWFTLDQVFVHRSEIRFLVISKTLDVTFIFNDKQSSEKVSFVIFGLEDSISVAKKEIDDLWSGWNKTYPDNGDSTDHSQSDTDKEEVTETLRFPSEFYNALIKEKEPDLERIRSTSGVTIEFSDLPPQSSVQMRVHVRGTMDSVQTAKGEVKKILDDIMSTEDLNHIWDIKRSILLDSVLFEYLRNHGDWEPLAALKNSSGVSIEFESTQDSDKVVYAAVYGTEVAVEKLIDCLITFIRSSRGDADATHQIIEVSEELGPQLTHYFPDLTMYRQVTILLHDGSLRHPGRIFSIYGNPNDVATAIYMIEEQEQKLRVSDNIEPLVFESHILKVDASRSETCLRCSDELFQALERHQNAELDEIPKRLRTQVVLERVPSPRFPRLFRFVGLDKERLIQARQEVKRLLEGVDGSRNSKSVSMMSQTMRLLLGSKKDELDRLKALYMVRMEWDRARQLAPDIEVDVIIRGYYADPSEAANDLVVLVEDFKQEISYKGGTSSIIPEAPKPFRPPTIQEISPSQLDKKAQAYETRHFERSGSIDKNENSFKGATYNDIVEEIQRGEGHPPDSETQIKTDAALPMVDPDLGSISSAQYLAVYKELIAHYQSQEPGPQNWHRSFKAKHRVKYAYEIFKELVEVNIDVAEAQRCAIEDEEYAYRTCESPRAYNESNERLGNADNGTDAVNYGNTPYTGDVGQQDRSDYTLFIGKIPGEAPKELIEWLRSSGKVRNIRVAPQKEGRKGFGSAYLDANSAEEAKNLIQSLRNTKGGDLVSIEYADEVNSRGYTYEEVEESPESMRLFPKSTQEGKFCLLPVQILEIYIRLLFSTRDPNKARRS